MRVHPATSILFPLLATLSACDGDSAITGPEATGQVRTYYIAADLVQWDYAPSGMNQITGEPFGEAELVFVGSDSNRIGRTYLKALYREYTDASFTTRKPTPPEWAHLGALGPVIRAEVGDTIRVVFRNNTTQPFSVHPHGVFYTKANEGAPYDDDTPSGPEPDDAVAPGATHAYVWPVPERAGPGPMDPSSIAWHYHSHVDETRDTNAGLVGAIIVTARGKARPDGRPVDVDREFVTLFTVFDENVSWFIDENIATFAGEPASVDPLDGEFEESNLMHSINGYVFGNLPLSSLQTRLGEKVRWYVIGLGTEVDIHTAHWHGQTGITMGTRADMVELLPASMRVFDMVPDAAGVWLYHCHVNDHIDAGMLARFQVLP